MGEFKDGAAFDVDHLGFGGEIEADGQGRGASEQPGGGAGGSVIEGDYEGFDFVILAEVGGEFFERIFAAGCEDEVQAARSELEGDFATDAGGGAVLLWIGHK